MLLAYEEAIERTLRGVGRLASERLSLERAADRVLAEDIVSVQPMPPFSHSAMDGYAVRASQLRGEGPWRMPVRGESRAGRPAGPLELGAACRIFTGAPVPEGANAVILQEDVERSAEVIVVRERPHEGQNIRPEGADMPRGTTALRAGARLHPGRLGLLAALDRAWVTVARQPVVTILSTGDELRSPGVAGAPSSIPESNSLVVAAIARRLGAVARTMPFVADDAARTVADVRCALSGSDLLVTVGGASVGEHDLVRPAMAAAGVSMEFWGVAIKPGKPVAVGSAGPARVVCLPGNPASAALTFLLFGVPLLRAMQGESPVRPRRVPMRVIGSHVRRPGREEYLRARLEIHDEELCAVLVASQASGAVTSFAEAEALVVLAADRARIDNGERLPVLQLAELWAP